MDNLPSFVKIFLFFAVPVVIGLHVVKFGVSHIYDVRIGNDGVDIVLLTRFHVKTIRFESIEMAYERSIFLLSEHDSGVSAFFTVPMMNRISIRAVILKLKSGCFRYIAFTPEDRHAFLTQVNSRIAGA
jgi:hypothetical protein